MTKHWVLLETGGNQRYIFASNRARHMVGASQLVLESCTTWVSGAAAGIPGIQPVQLVSGKALLLADSQAAGQELIRTVSRRALVEAPGLELTGAVGPGFDETLTYTPPPEGLGDDERSQILATRELLDHVTALIRTFTQQRLARGRRPAQELRAPILPWHQPCRETSRPAAWFELYGATPRAQADWHPASASLRARSIAKPLAQQRLSTELGDLADVVPKNLTDLAEDGWVAVVHADGNGVGALFQQFPDLICIAEKRAELDLTTHVRYLTAVGQELETATAEAFKAGLQQALSDWSGPREGILLPIIIGGDDVTFTCHARLALPLTRGFLAEFELRTKASTHLSALIQALTGGSANWLSAAAGIALVKPHHPFDLAYDLAEELARSAKVTKQALHLPVSSLDLHLAHESTLRPLADLREATTVGDSSGPRMMCHAGPYLVTDPSTHDTELPADQSEWLARGSITHLDALHSQLSHLEQPDHEQPEEPSRARRLSSARAHDLRGALDRGPEDYQATLQLVLARSQAGPALRDLLEPKPAHLPGQPPGDTFVRLLDAMMLQGAGLRVRHGNRPHRIA